MKLLLTFVFLAFLSVSVFGQSNGTVTSNTLPSAPIVVSTTNTAPSGNLVLNTDGTITVNPQDLLSFLPNKYKSLILLLIALSPGIIKIITAYKAGGTTSQALASAFVDKHVQLTNEIAALKARTGLPPTPAPAAPSVPVVAPAPVLPPLTSLPPVGSLPVIQPNPQILTIKP